MGYNFSRRMTAKCCVVALERALKSRSYPERKLI
ncbi:MAG: hypothetical protein ACI9CQ_004566, partial [Saprospiraceae bacterium]